MEIKSKDNSNNNRFYCVKLIGSYPCVYEILVNVREMAWHVSQSLECLGKSADVLVCFHPSNHTLITMTLQSISGKASLCSLPGFS